MTLLQRHPLLYGLLIAVAVAFGIRLSQFVLGPLVFYQAGSAVCWPTDGIMIAVLLLSRRKFWPWIAAGFVADMFIAADHTLLGIAFDAFCNLLEIFAAAWFLPPFQTMSQWIRQPRMILRFTLVAVILAPLGAALIGGEYFRDTVPPQSYQDIVFHWLTGDALGIALWTPLILSLFSRETYDIFKPARLPITTFLFAVSLAVTWAVFSQRAYPLSFLIFPMLVVVVNLLGFPGAVFLVNAITIIASSATIRGHGPFMFVEGVHAPFRIVTLQIYLILAMLMSFTIALIGLERKAFEERLKLALSQMESLATIDALTAVGNRRLFDVTFSSEWKRAFRDRTCIALLMIDADHFKSYNDLYGHLAGDAALQEIAQVLITTVRRAGDLPARYGGEEFAALLPRTTLPQALAIAEILCRRVKLLGMEHTGNEHGRVTISVGCSAVIPTEALTPEALIRAADTALYTAKQDGRDCVAFALPIEDPQMAVPSSP